TFFKCIGKYSPFLTVYHFKIETSISFPHCSGIASSASEMSALALCLLSIEKLIIEANVTLSAVERSFNQDYFNQKASFLARLGSGSACRGIEGDLIDWGNTGAVNESYDLYGINDTIHVIITMKDNKVTI